MGMLQDTIKNLRKLADATKKAGTPANIGVTYKVDTTAMLVSGTFAFQLQKVDSSGSPDFGYDAVDFLASPPSALTLTPTTFAANTSTNIAFTYSGSTTPLPDSPTARMYPAGITPADGSDRAVGNSTPVSNNAGTFVGVSLPAGSYKVLIYSNVAGFPLVPGVSATFTVA